MSFVLFIVVDLVLPQEAEECISQSVKMIVYCNQQQWCYKKVEVHNVDLISGFV